MSPCFDDRGNVIGKKDGVFTPKLTDLQKTLFECPKGARLMSGESAENWARKRAESFEAIFDHCHNVKQANVIIVLARGPIYQPRDCIRWMERQIHFYTKRTGRHLETEDIRIEPSVVRLNLRIYPEEYLCRVTIVKANPDNLRGYEPSAIFIDDAVSARDEVTRQAHMQLGRRNDADLKPRPFTV